MQVTQKVDMKKSEPDQHQCHAVSEDPDDAEDGDEVARIVAQSEEEQAVVGVEGGKCLPRPLLVRAVLLFLEQAGRGCGVRDHLRMGQSLSDNHLDEAKHGWGLDASGSW